MNETIVVSVKNCARCNKNHENIEFTRFTQPIFDSDGTMWDYWALCPETTEPILLKKEEKKS